jgi:hypothetical protein
MKITSFVGTLLLLTVIGFLPAHLQAQETITEKEGVATGVTAGNAFAVPLKAVSVVIGALSGVLSFIVTGGDTEVTKQVWRDTTEGPYAITPDVARKAVGKRPELELEK